MKYVNSFFSKILNSPLLWGGLVTYVFYVLLHRGTIDSGILTRYLAMHPIEYLETTMFFVGITALALKAFELSRHRKGLLAHPILPDTAGHKVDLRSCDSYLRQVEQFLARNGESYYPCRLFHALKYVRQCESAEQLDEELRYLADEDAIGSDSSYGFTQLIIWAIPILGFLGTVVGIAVAMGNLNPEELETSLPLVMSGLTVAFDTTAVALAFSIILFFSKYSISRQENAILSQVDRAINEELRGRFELVGTAAEQREIVIVRKMLEAVTANVETLFQIQVQTWTEAMHAADTRHAALTCESVERMKAILAPTLRENLEHHARSLAASESKLLEKTEHAVLALNTSVREQLEVLSSLEEQLVRQTEVFGGIVEATGQITALEQRLNQNLAALSGSRNFEETVNSLAAVIHLLNSKLSDVTVEPRIVHLPRREATAAPHEPQAETGTETEREHAGPERKTIRPNLHLPHPHCGKDAA